MLKAAVTNGRYAGFEWRLTDFLSVNLWPKFTSMLRKTEKFS